MLVETDSPFLAPVPFRGKRNEPAYVNYVAHTIAEIKKLSFETVAADTSENARSLFGIPSREPS
jgi:TatD DNase family protein